MNKIIQFLLCNTLFIFNAKSECSNCDYRYEPVCASNGFTYGSVCEFECLNDGSTNVTIVSTGECASLCIKKRKPGIWSPYVIAKLKRNYYDCTENERCLKVIHASKSTVNCFCLEPDAPICGTDQKVYENSCIFYCISKKKNITAANKGNCWNLKNLSSYILNYIQTRIIQRNMSI